MCTEYEDGFSYLKKDTNIRCWEGDHSIFAYTIGIPFIIIWALIFPLYITYSLWKIRDDFGKEKNLKIFGIFYIGLNDNSFYLEIGLTSFRKIVLILCATLFGSSSNPMKVWIKTNFIGFYWHFSSLFLKTLFAL